MATVYGQRSMLYGRGSRERRKDVTFYGAVGRERFFRMGGADGNPDLVGGTNPTVRSKGRHPRQMKYNKPEKPEKQ